MTKKQEYATSLFTSGLNCSQSVVMAFAEDLNYDSDLAKNLAIGFGGGMGRLQETCGAVTGSFIVLGIYCSKKFLDIKTQKENSYTMVQNFDNSFKNIHNSTNCKTLLNCDLRTNAGQNYFKENNLINTICKKCVSDSVSILEKMIK